MAPCRLLCAPGRVMTYSQVHTPPGLSGTVSSQIEMTSWTDRASETGAATRPVEEV